MMPGNWWVLRVLVTSALVVQGCASGPHHPPLPADLSEEPVRACDVEKHVRAKCSQLERMELTSAKRGRLNVSVENCGSGGGAVFVSFPPIVPNAPVHSMVVEFGDTRGNGPRVPFRLDPVAMEWPCVEHCEHEELVAKVPVLDPCDANAQLEGRTFVLPAVTATSCLGAALKNEAQKLDFCREPLARGATIYRIATRSAWSALWQETRLELREGESFAEVTIRKENGPVVRGVVEAAVWEERLGAIWGMPSEVREDCYEQGLETATALREGAWRVVVRRCASVVDLRDLTLTTSRMGAEP
ncbi:MAG TPA: hypothetical protein VNN72_24785 [Polyangiaceae bacterium]|nr:hypothetical protein [Polyangiaceae bacterium]